MSEIDWNRYPVVAHHPYGRAWLQIQRDLQRAPNTVDAYGRGLQDYLTFCIRSSIDPDIATRAHIVAYVRDLAERPRSGCDPVGKRTPGAGLANATMHQRLTIVRLYYEYLFEEGVRADNPVGRGRAPSTPGVGAARERGLIPHFRRLPWIPNDEQWQALLAATRLETIRNRFMVALSYDTALRREEVCSIATMDIDPGRCLLHIRAETTKNRRERVVPYSEVTNDLYAAYLHNRRTLTRERGPLFLSESRRNHAQPLSIWTWSKVVASIAERAAIPQFTPHTLRHLRLTDLARAHWELHEIAQFAGHQNIQTTLLYIHRSGRDLADKLARTMVGIHAWRIKMIAEVLQ